MEIVIGIGAFWILCGVLDYGIMLAYFQREFPVIAEFMFEEDRRDSISFFALGPISLADDLLSGYGKHGLMFRNPHKRNENET